MKTINILLATLIFSRKGVYFVGTVQIHLFKLSSVSKSTSIESSWLDLKERLLSAVKLSFMEGLNKHMLNQQFDSELIADYYGTKKHFSLTLCLL